MGETILPPSPAAPSRRVYSSLFLTAAVAALNLIPLWWFRFFPSQDGPAHLENAVALAEYGRADRPLLQSFYTINPNPDPNWFGHVFLAALIRLGTPPLIAEKVLLSGYLLGLPLSVWYAARGVRPDGGWVAVLSVPLAANGFLHMGFYNFCWSLVGFFLIVGYWLRHRDHFTPLKTLILAALVTATYFCHLVAVAATGLAIAVLSLWWTGQEWVVRRRAGGLRWKPLGSRAVLPFVAFLPALVMGALFTIRQSAAARSADPPPTWLAMAVQLTTLDALVSYSPAELLVAAGLAFTLLGLTGGLVLGKLFHRRWAAGDEHLLVAAAFVVVFFAAPNEAAGGSFLKWRLGLFPYFGLLLWLPTLPLGALPKRALQGAAALATVLLLAFHWHIFTRSNELLDEYLAAASALQENSTLLPISFDYVGRDDDGQGLSKRVGPFRHAAGYLAAERPVVTLLNYEAGTGYFPLRYRPDIDPAAFLVTDANAPPHSLAADRPPPRVNIAGYEGRTGVRVEYVLLWGLSGRGKLNQEAQDALAELLHQLAGRYERVYPPADSAKSFVQVYRRKADGPP